ncbi:MAG: hypothetical protein ACJAX4_004819, partial [Clostridium sp.]
MAYFIYCKTSRAEISVLLLVYLGYEEHSCPVL